MLIQWYPGHMTKARRMLEDVIKQIDLVVEVRDARVPYSSFNPDIESILKRRMRIVLLNKADLADPETTRLWKASLEKQGCVVIPYTATQKGGGKPILNRIQSMMQGKVDAMKQKGVSKTVRVLVAGIPNVGKSTLINQLSGGGKTKTANKPGVTRGKQWIRVTPYLELLDTPGLLWPKFEDPVVGLHLAMIGSIRDEVTDPYALSLELLDLLKKHEAPLLCARYKLENEDVSLESDALMEKICKKRGFMLSGGRLDVDRGVAMLLDEFRDGKIGRISLERPEIPVQEEA